MNDRLELMEKRYEELQELMQDPEVVMNVKLVTSYAKEARGLEDVVKLYREEKKAK